MVISVVVEISGAGTVSKSTIDRIVITSSLQYFYID